MNDGYEETESQAHNFNLFTSNEGWTYGPCRTTYNDNGKGTLVISENNQYIAYFFNPVFCNKRSIEACSASNEMDMLYTFQH